MHMHSIKINVGGQDFGKFNSLADHINTKTQSENKTNFVG